MKYKRGYVLKNFTVPVWNVMYNVIVCPDTSLIKTKWVKSLLEDDLKVTDYDKGIYAYRVNSDSSTNYIIFLKDLDNVPTIAHEAMHFVFDILEQKGVTYSKDSEESYTYLLGYVVGQILSIKV